MVRATVGRVSPIGLMLSCFAVAAILMAALNFLGGGKWRRSQELHWSERARLLFPVRVSAQLNLLVLTTISTLAAFADAETRGLWAGFLAAGFSGAILGCYPLNKEVIPEFTFPSWLAQVALGWGTRILVLAPFVLGLVFASPVWDFRTVCIGIAFAIWQVWSSRGGLVDILRWLHVLRPISDSVLATLREAFSATHITPRRVLLLPSPFLLAFALPFRKELIFSHGLIKKCSAGELNAICLHELAHLSEDKGILAQRLLSSFVLFPLIFLRPAFGTWGLPGVLAIYTLAVLLGLSAKRVGRRAEIRADQLAAGAELNEGVYARALEKIYASNQMPAVLRGKRQIHPDLYDRMLAAGVTPDFQRPKAPAWANWTILVPISIGAGLMVYLRWSYGI